MPARAIEIERALTEAGGYRFEEPSHHGEQPILAVHDQALLEVLATAWDDALAAGVTDGSQPLIPGTLLTTAFAAGHDTGLPGPGHRVFGYTFDTATPIVSGTYRAARVAVDVALTALDLSAVAPIWPTACAALPATMRGGRCTAGTASSTTRPSWPRRLGWRGVTDRDPRHRLPPRERDPAAVLGSS